MVDMPTAIEPDPESFDGLAAGAVQTAPAAAIAAATSVKTIAVMRLGYVGLPPEGPQHNLAPGGGAKDGGGNYAGMRARGTGADQQIAACVHPVSSPRAAGRPAV
jgi:hypothetical protein